MSTKWLIVFLLLIIAAFLIPFGGDLNVRVQILISIILLFTLFVAMWQSTIAENDAKLRHRPLVGMVDVKAVILGDSTELNDKSEVSFVLRFENVGLSAAHVEYIDIKVYYAYVQEMKVEAPNESEIASKVLRVEALIADTGGDPETIIKIERNKVLPLKSSRYFREITLLPRQSTNVQFMAHALTLQQRLFQNPKRPLPVVIEVEMKYGGLGHSVYYHNSLNSLTWLPAHHNLITSRLNKSNDTYNPIHLTGGELEETIKRILGKI